MSVSTMNWHGLSLRFVMLSIRFQFHAVVLFHRLYLSSLSFLVFPVPSISLQSPRVCVSFDGDQKQRSFHNRSPIPETVHHPE